MPAAVHSANTDRSAGLGRHTGQKGKFSSKKSVGCFVSRQIQDGQIFAPAASWTCSPTWLRTSVDSANTPRSMPLPRRNPPQQQRPHMAHAHWPDVALDAVHHRRLLLGTGQASPVPPAAQALPAEADCAAAAPGGVFTPIGGTRPACCRWPC